ncbi:Vacuolar protein sorting 26 (Vps26) [Paratrimastix pyriformis]|uniref:Vacuolar protein sorting 26 (Vps26) n=1 Tax=Paratrimastix pyriformis TaxID=342808 RepID=A0ABQ8U997_9EUKA|nr:Vacuolar protein sorting 26 (Vps26) [Paratrimastix pyriformis]|eukprot:GAFH01002997.1.p1 GENE.GAFH01002997.1~~GAFH01002997.1.p1  ORF type:complete len:302 (-),score=74.81 GAFH01002997.1:93-998(-)
MAEKMKKLVAGLIAPCNITITFENEEGRKKIRVPGDKPEDLPLFLSTEPVRGTVHVEVMEGKKIDHMGMKVELLGQIEMFYDRGNHYDFTSVVREIETPGQLVGVHDYPFEFSTVAKEFESYNGINVRLRYFVQATITRQYSTNIQKQRDFFVQALTVEPETNTGIKMEVGIEDALHIEFEYNRSKYHLRDVIIGKISFVRVKIKIKHMELAIIKRESTFSGSNVYHETDTVTKFEVMDGCPVREEVIPIRLFLGGTDLTPTYPSVNNRFQVKYFLNLVLVDEEDRRYYKQQEITLWRKEL